MKHLKRFNESVSNEAEILEYLKENYPEEWFDQELSNRVDDYVSEEDAEDYGGDLEEAYKSLCMGGAVEYDLLDVISKDLQERFNLTSKDYYDGVDDIVNDYLMDTCTWYDRYVFNKSDEGYVSNFEKMFGKNNLTKHLDDKFGTGSDPNPIP